MITHSDTHNLTMHLGSSQVLQRFRNNVGKRETETPREKTLKWGTPEGLDFRLIQTLFVFIVGETYLRPG